ncbi:MAG: hypothetical protein M0P64_02255 [Candidatus Pacebacteria bacterium]|jgi:hypothetical protein|nr:hypothetical protein [Candidatus Paceibacterota bacterium]
MQRKVDAMNGRVPQSSSKTNEKQKPTTSTPEEIKKEDEEKVRRNWMAMIILFIVTICIAYLLPDDSSMFIVIGAVVVIPLHIMGLWLLFTGSKVSDITKVMVVGYFAIATIGLILPEPVYQTWKDMKASVRAANHPTFFKEAFGSSSPAASTEVTHEVKSHWVKFDPDVYTLAEDNNGNPDDESVIVDGPPDEYVELPPIPTGVVFDIYCPGGRMFLWENDQSKGWFQDCGTKIGHFNGMLHAGVAAKYAPEVLVSVKLQY